MSLDSTFIRTGVTAITIFDDVILAGIGSSLYIFSNKSKKPLQRLICLNGQKIYGFKQPDLSECIFIVFGGKQFTIVLGPDHIQHGPTIFTKMFEPIVCDDWLHSVMWTPGDKKTIMVLTAHNVVQKYDIDTQNLISQHHSKDNSILYSGLLLALEKDVLVMAGTVYSEVILYICGEDEPLHRLKGHKGVIFSISCHPEKNIIVTTSDDRSVRVWGPASQPQEPWSSTEYWRSEIVCKHELYGHQARVMRSKITDNYIISVGEDSYMCFWSHDGVLNKKVNLNVSFWSIDILGPMLVTGGGDGSVIIHSSSPDNYSKSLLLQPLCGKLNHISYSASQNIFTLYDSKCFIYLKVKDIDKSTLLQFDQPLHALSVSPDRRMCAVAARKSFILVVKEEKEDTVDSQFSVTFSRFTLENKTILSVHWASNALLVACTQNGLISVVTVNAAFDPFAQFELPFSKERWLTCAAVNKDTEVFILGDRCGSIYLYKKGSIHPLKTLSRVHGRYGPTSITIRDDEVVTTGRDRTIKYFQITEDELTLTSTKEVDFHWVERFLEFDEQIVCGFKDNMFIVFCLKSKQRLMELACGGGHRSWDVLFPYEKNVHQPLNFMYIRSTNVHMKKLKLRTAFAVVKGSHSKEINCLKSHQIDERIVFLSGGEDTTLRVSLLDTDRLDFEDLAVSKNLSSVRTLKIYTKDRYEVLVISAGGRAQICIKSFKFIKQDNEIVVKTHDLVNYMLKGTDKQRKGAHSWKNITVDLLPETRIMDIDYVKNKDRYTIFAGCSDARIRVFAFSADRLTFKIINESNYLQSCILKTVCITYLKRDILITCTTRGEVALWDATNVEKSYDFAPFFVTTTNKSGINSFVTRNLPDSKILIATGGDDNALHINVLTVSDHHNFSSMKVLHSLVLDKYHSSAITGLCLIDDFILTSSIDQRITLYVWKVAHKIECDFVYQTYSDIADIKGMEIMNQDSSSVSVCVFGKGIETFKIPTSQT